MSVKTLTSFQRVYLKLKKNSERKFYIEFYHNDIASEPTISIDSYPEKVFVDFTEEHGNIINIFTKESTIGFSEKNYDVTVSDDVILFNSKHDDETYYIIHFN